MADAEVAPEEVTAPAPDEAAETAPESAETEQRIPLNRFKAVTDENKTLRERLDALETEKREREEAELSEIEKERLARENAENALEEARLRAETLEKSQWLKDAASMAGFADPEDATALVALADIDGPDAARAAVNELAERKPHLVKSQETGPRPMAAPLGGAAPADTSDPKAGLGADLLQHLTRR